MDNASQSSTTVENADFIPIAIIGAGFSGIATGCRIKEKLGFSQFKIFDQMDDVGGVWRRQKYPGVACDIPAPLYSLSFAQNTGWSTLTPSGEEIQQYLHCVCRKYRILDNIQLNTEITHLSWEDSSNHWKLSGFLLNKESGRQTFSIYAKVIINATGKFAKPNLADIANLPGIEKFDGDILHTSAWDSSLSFEGKDVIVVGSGCTAAQVVPSLLTSPFNARSVTQLMRSAPWVRPRFLSKKAVNLWEQYMPWFTRNIPVLTVIIRRIIFLITESHFFLIFGSSVGRKSLKRKLLRYMQQAAPKGYHDILTPDYEVGCKRFVQDVVWFECLHDSRAHLTTAHLKRFEKDTVVLEDRDSGEEKRTPAQVIVLATGYDTSTFSPSISITGQNGIELHQLWTARGGPQAYMGLAIDKFPNLFFLGGPNSSNGHTSVIINIENGVNYILKLLRPIINGDVSKWEVKEDACTRWTLKIQNASKNRVWKTGGCSNWYIGKNGWNGLLYPFSHFYNTYCMMFPTWRDWTITYTAKGICANRGPSVRSWILLSLFIFFVLAFSSVYVVTAREV